MTILRTAVAMVASIAVPLAVQLWDRRRLSAERREGSWNVATWGSALYAFGPLSMLGWCWVTRPRGWRVLSGPLWAGACLFVVTLIDAAVELAQRGRLEDSIADRGVAAAAIAAGSITLVGVMELVREAWRQRRRLGIGAACPPPSPPPSAPR